MSKNDITGDTLVTKVASPEYLDNYDRIFRKMKVRICQENEFEFVMFDEQTCQILGIPEDMLVEVPISLVNEYKEYSLVREKMMNKLKEIYERAY